MKCMWDAVSRKVGCDVSRMTAGAILSHELCD